MEHQDYQHTPLSSEDSIRVFDLLPSTDFADPIHCRLRQVSLSSVETKYEALSYVWGSREGTQPIFCDGRRLLVTPNCAAALSHLRHQTQERALWIDAICIDQKEDDVSARERNHQVQEMGRIYSTASRVVVWLGLPTDRFGQLLHRLTTGEVTFENTAEFNPPVMTLSSQPWFVRVWTLQEIAFSREAVVKIGPHELAWHDVAATLTGKWNISPYSETKSLSIRDKFRGMVNESRTSTQVTNNYLAHTRLFRLIPELQCTRDQDRIFGLHSILTQTGLTLPRPDYDKPISHIFQEAVVSFIRSYGKLDLVSLTIPPRLRHDTPSWVPDWLAPPPRHLLFEVHGTFPPDGPFLFPRRASGYSRAEAPSVFTNGKLPSKGKHLGNIRLRLSCEPEGPADQFGPGGVGGFVRICREWCETLYMSLGNASTGIIEESIRCIPPYHLWSGSFQAWVEVLSSTNTAHPTLEFEPSMEKACRFQRNRVDRGTHYAFIRLGDNLFGRAHYSCAEGDDVYLLAGSDVPLVLRRDGDNYRVVAPAYIIGAMKGEYWPEDESTLETITLV